MTLIDTDNDPGHDPLTAGRTKRADKIHGRVRAALDKSGSLTRVKVIPKVLKPIRQVNPPTMTLDEAESAKRQIPGQRSAKGDILKKQGNKSGSVKVAALIRMTPSKDKHDTIVDMLQRAAADEELPASIRILAAKTVLPYIELVANDKPFAVDFNGIATLDTPAAIVDASSQCIHAAAAGKITARQANDVIKLLMAQRSNIETVEFDKRLAALEGLTR